MYSLEFTIVKWNSQLKEKANTNVLEQNEKNHKNLSTNKFKDRDKDN